MRRYATILLLIMALLLGELAFFGRGAERPMLDIAFVTVVGGFLVALVSEMRDRASWRPTRLSIPTRRVRHARRESE